MVQNSLFIYIIIFFSIFQNYFLPLFMRALECLPGKTPSILQEKSEADKLSTDSLLYP